ncbi:hypothetical protein KFL_004210080 [Klebsormidium nitens]|uniref:BTB domain-containing protein n=1 Tax=Klebsormidium nitens TaxID=105231 RepID=A0A1Y1IBS1_KLENI|nr:hypothetical protein KFL_004210080 [Klebsormidium nitens]|eukprot:GAQ88360.1 hypothetical protein KFL_004210080 [Klebsormidium nitens]
MAADQALSLLSGMDLLNSDQQPDVVVVLLLARSEEEPESAKRRCRREEPRRLALHSTVLRQGSPFFAALLRWDSERDTKGQEPLQEVVVEGCQDLDASVLALQLLYCRVLNKTPVGQIIVQGVEHALAVLKACTYFPSESGIEYCRSFLGAAKWDHNDRESIHLCFGNLGLELGTDLTERLNVQKSKTVHGRSFSLDHKLALGSLKTLWTSDDAENFVSRVPEIFVKLNDDAVTKPLLDVFAQLFLKPLEKLFICASEEPLPFSEERSRTNLLRLWVPIMLTFEQAELLHFYFEPYWIEAIFNSLSQEAKHGFLEKWLGEKIILSPDVLEKGTVGNFLNTQVECYLIQLERAEFVNGDEQPDVIVSLKLKELGAAAKSHRRRRKQVMPRRLELHSSVLREGSPFFAALLRWEAASAKVADQIPQLAVDGCGDLDSSVLALQLLYCDVLNKPAVGRVVLQGVKQALSILEASSYFLNDFGVEHCKSFLEAAKWTPQDREAIGSCFKGLVLEMGPDLSARMNVEPKDKAAAQAIVRGLFDAAISPDGPTYEQKKSAFYFFKQFAVKTTERPRKLLEEQADAGWIGLDAKTVQSIAEGQIQKLSFARALRLLMNLRFWCGESDSFEILFREEHLRPFIRELSCLGWQTAFCLRHGLGLTSVEAFWTSNEALQFATGSSQKLFSLYDNRATKPLLEMFGKLIFEPLEKLFICASDKNSGFGKKDRATLMQIWLPVLLRFEQAVLLGANFKPSSVETLFMSLSQAKKQDLLEKWSSEEVSVSANISAEGTIQKFISEQLRSLSRAQLSDPLESMARQVEAFKGAKDQSRKDEVARVLNLSTIQLIRMEPHRICDLAKFWSERDIASSILIRDYSLILDTSVRILEATADVNNLVPGNVRFSFLSSVLPILLEADKTGGLKKEAAEAFETVLSTLATCKQEQLALRWSKKTGQKDTDSTEHLNRLFLDEVFSKWCETPTS